MCALPPGDTHASLSKLARIPRTLHVGLLTETDPAAAQIAVVLEGQGLAAARPKPASIVAAKAGMLDPTREEERAKRSGLLVP